MNSYASDILRFIDENDVKFVRLAFPDLGGAQKNIAVLASELPRVLLSGAALELPPEDGYPAGTAGYRLAPDTASAAKLPWRPSHGSVARFWCDIKTPDGAPAPFCCRSFLRGADTAAKDHNINIKFGTESEFYLFKSDEDGNSTGVPFDRAGYLDVAPADRGENVRREICFSLEELGITPESSHHERGPGQNEIDFAPGWALETADNLMTFKYAVSTIAARNGLCASFAPKPLPDSAGSGMHINMALYREGENMLHSEEYRDDADCFAAGILAHAAELAAFLCPTENSYARLADGAAHKQICLAGEMGTNILRIAPHTDTESKLELLCPDPACNPYIAFGLLIYAGLDGITRALDLEKAGGGLLPGSLAEARRAAGNSAFVGAVLPREIAAHFLG